MLCVLLAFGTMPIESLRKLDIDLSGFSSFSKLRDKGNNWYNGLLLKAAANTTTSDFSYTILNGSYISITGYSGGLKSITLPESIDDYIVQSISSEAFKNNTNLEMIVFPSTIETLGNASFSGCTSLSSLVFVSGLTTIGTSSFAGCTSLTTIELPSTLETIGASAFSGCTSLENIGFSNSLTTIDNKAFEGCTNLKTIDLPNSLATIGGYAFSGCTGLTSVEFPASVKTIGYRAFYKCTSLASVVYPVGWTTASSYYESYRDNYGNIFEGCTSLSEIIVPEGVTVIPAYAFKGCTNIKTVSLPNTLITISGNAFSGCTALTQINISESVSSVGASSFSGCTSLKTIDFPKSLKTIGASAFSGCKALENVSFNDGLTTVGGKAFEGCTNLKAIDLPNSLVTIEGYAFSGCTSLTSVEFPASVKTIGYRAFYKCTGLASIVYPVGWTTASSYYESYRDNYGNTFEGCTALSEIIVPEGVTVIPTYAFKGCTSIKTVSLPSTLTKINDNTFNGCTGLVTINFSENIVSIGTSAFGNCTALKNIVLNNKLTTIGNHAFSGCTGLAAIELSNGLTTIGAYAFNGCSSLTKVEFPASVTTIGYRAFYNCSKISSIVYPIGWKTASAYYESYRDNYGKTFEGCQKLRFVEVPEGVTTIPAYAFNGCTFIRTVTLPSTVTTIGDYAFNGCAGLENIWIGEEVKTIGANSFVGCSKLTIHGVSDSYAEMYATEKSIPFSGEKLNVNFSTVIGKIIDEDGNGIADVSVSFYNKDKNEVIDECYTDAEGNWSYNSVLVEYSYVARFHHPNYTFDNNNVEFKAVSNGVELSDTIATLNISVSPSPESEFTYTVLNGSYISISGYTGSSAEIAIPSAIDGYTVQKISDNAFKGKTSLTTIVLPSTLETIGASAFSGCTSLENIGFSNSLTTIDNKAFEGCTNLKTIDLPNSLATIGGYAFSGCTGLTSVEFPASVKTIGYRAFYKCTSLASVVYPVGWTTASSYYESYRDNYGNIFEGCTSLSEIIVPEGVTVIPAYAFKGCTNIKTVSLPNTLITISGNAFSGCTALTQINISESVSSVGASSFSGCTSLKTIDFPKSLKTIGASAFSGCKALENVSFNDGLTTVGGKAFEGCTNLKAIDLPNSLVTIEGYAFSGCTSLTSVEFPASVKTIGYRAFYKCTGLASIVYPVGWTTASSYYESYRDNYGNTFEGCTALSEIIVPEGVTVIPTYAFKGCTSIKTVSLPSTLTKINDNTFNGCTGLVTINFSENIVSIGTSAFGNCTALKNIVLNNKLTTIGNHAFSGCTGLAAIELSNGLTTIGAYAFNGCSSLTKVEFPASVTTIGYRAFYNCSKISSIVYPIGWKTASAYYESYRDNYGKTFEGCQKLRFVEVPEGVTTIPAYAFNGCTFIRTVTLPSTVTTIGDYAFNGCAGFTDFVVPNSTQSIGKNTFENCISLKRLEITSDNISIGSNALNSCERLVVSTVTTSNAVDYCIANDINFVIISSNDESDTQDGIVIKEKSSYKIITQSTINNTTTVIVEYSLKNTEGATNITIEVALPLKSELVNSSLSIDGVKTNAYSVKDNILNVPIESISGIIKFSIALSSEYSIQSYAKIKYNINNLPKEEIIGVITSTQGLLTVSAPSKTSKNFVDVYGIAPPSSNVEISVDSKVVSTVLASKTGKYTVRISLDNVEEFKTYEISASTRVDDKVLQSSTITNYSKDAIIVNKFDLYYNNHTNAYLDLLSVGNSKPSLPIFPSKPLTFVVNTNNNDKIESMNIVSKKNGEIKTIPALYDPSTDTFIASGLFDKENMYYLPGEMSVEYVEKKENIAFDDISDYSKEDYEYLIDKDVTVNLIENSENRVSYCVEMPDGSDFEQTIEKKKVFDVLDETFAEAHGYLKVVDKEEVVWFYKIITPNTSAGEKLEYGLEIFKKYDEEIISFLCDKNVASAYTYLKETVYTPVDNYIGVLGKLHKAAKAENELYNLQWQINADSSLSESERQAKTNLINLATLFNGISCIGGISITAFAAIGAISGPWITACTIVVSAFGYLANEYTNHLNGEAAFESFLNAFAWVNWLLDPSGYVYEAVPSNRIEGVRTTIYYKDPISSSAVVWNAEDYDQVNPLFTDVNGCYAWDVPEGKWQVKYEKEGYETEYSEWLDVPPPQLDVNISMKSLLSPEVEYVNVYKNKIEIKFNQFMNIETINSQNIVLLENGNKLIGKFNALDKEFNSLDGSEYASIFEFIPAVEINDKININISNVENYCGTTLLNVFTATNDIILPIDSLVVDESISVAYGSSKSIIINAIPAKAVEGKKIIVTMSDSYIVKAKSLELIFDNEGKAILDVEAILPGTVNIDFSIEDTSVKTSTNIVVEFSGFIEISDISINSPITTMYVGENHQLTASVSPDNATNKSVKWTSSNEEVAEISEDGIIKGLSEGTSLITVQSTYNKDVFSSFTITVEKSIRDVHTVKWIVDGISSTVEYAVGDYIVSPETPQKTGYHFVEWYPTVPVTMPNNDLVFEAIFEKNNYTVNWTVNEKTTSQIYQYGETIKAFEEPNVEGFVFVGWTPSIPATMPAYDLTFTAVFERLPDCTISIKKPSTTSISYKSGIILHAETANLPDGAYVEWTSSNNNFTIKEKSSNGSSITIISAANGDTIFTATVVDANGKPILDVNGNPIKAEQNMTSKAGFFDKVIAFFKGLFGLNKILPQAFKGVF